MATVLTRPETAQRANARRDLKVYMHSPLLYWWPVWAVGFAMALWTYLDGYRLALVPEQTHATGNQLVAPQGTLLEAPGEHMVRSRLPGIIFVSTLLAVILFNHLWLRGVWGLFISACVVTLLALASWLDWWDPLYRWFGLLRIHINLGGYVVIATTLFVAWLLTVFFFDRRTYMIFSTGQVRIRDELGAQEKVFDAGSIAFEKRPYDWFRWLVGFGAGDLLVKTGGPQAQIIELPNVIRVSRWLQDVEGQMRTRHVV